MEAEGRARAERTANMSNMFVTLDVSKLSGWLNNDASYRVTGRARRRGHMRAGSGGRGGAAAVQAACREVPTVAAEGKARAKRTANIHPMFETLDVSRLSGWLNAVASCQVKEGSIRRRGDMQAGRREGVGRRQRCKQRAGSPRLWGLRVGQARSAPQTWIPCS